MTVYLLERPKSGILKTANTGEVVSNRNSHSLLMGMKNGAATLGESLAVSYLIKYTLTIQSKNLTPWYVPRKAHTKACTEMFIAVLLKIELKFANSLEELQ